MMNPVLIGRMKADVIREIADLRKNEFHKTLAMLRAQLNLLMMDAATQNKKSLHFNVPMYYVGREPYDPIEMGKELVNQLKEDDYTVTGTYVSFTISWAKPVAKAVEKDSDEVVVVVPSSSRRGGLRRTRPAGP